MSESEADGEDFATAIPQGVQCEMPECKGEHTKDEHHAVRDPDGDLLEMCDGCLDEGWRQGVEVLD